jgi:Fe2+ or Zn2+ uptake regulation protein
MRGTAAIIQEAFERTALRRTPQRYAVLEYLLHHQGQPPNRSRWRSTRAIRAGLVKEVVLQAGPVRYDANLEHHHHHFICQRCGGLEDFSHFNIPSFIQRSKLGAAGTQLRDRLSRFLSTMFCQEEKGETHGKSSQTGSGTGGRQSRRAAG